MVHKEMVEHAYDGIGALPHVDSLVNQVVHLSGEGLTTHTEDGILRGVIGPSWRGSFFFIYLFIAISVQ